MKKLFLSAIMALTMGAVAQAQIVSSTSRGINSQPQEEKKTTTNENSGGGFNFDFLGVEKGWGLGMDFGFSHFLIGWGMMNGETNDYVTDNSAFDVHIGGMYRYFIPNSPVYIEGRALFGVNFGTLKYKTVSGYSKYGTARYTTNKNNSTDVFLGLTPRIGVNIFKNVGISVGYRWDFVKFKFDKESTRKFFTVGIAATI